MKITYVPVLGILRELYSQPRTLARFRTYLETLTGGTDDVVIPIGQANPMAREHALASLDHLDAIGADDVGRAATESAQHRLAGVKIEPEIKATIVLADDLGGGWTNRHTTEAMVRFPSRGVRKRPFATALVWTSETPSADQVRSEVQAAIYRVAYHLAHGPAQTLRAMLVQEGLAAAFAGESPTLDAASLARIADRVAGLDRDTAPYPTIFAVLYGDPAARELGYEPLGLPARAGFDLALAEASGRDPVAELAVLGSRQQP